MSMDNKKTPDNNYAKAKDIIRRLIEGKPFGIRDLAKKLNISRTVLHIYFYKREIPDITNMILSLDN